MEGESCHNRVGGQAQAHDKDARTNGVFGFVSSAPSVPPPSSSSPSLSSSQRSFSSKGNGSSVPDDSWRKDGDDQSDENTKNVSDISIQKDSEEGLNTEQEMEGFGFDILNPSKPLHYHGQDVKLKWHILSPDGNEDDPISNSSNSASSSSYY